jgi:mannan endo-1,4-beta-mannosidase
MTRGIVRLLAVLLLAGTSTAPALAGPPRPGFRVEGRYVYDHLGERVLLRGVNKMNVWTDRTGASFAEIRKSGANTVRIVWAMNGGDWIPAAADLDTVIGRAIENQLIPMIELHDATGNWAMLQTLVDYWVRPDIVAVIQKYERHLLVNIGNEVGDHSIGAGEFLAGYADAVARMRAAGIHTPLVIDAPDYGKNLDVLTETAPSLLAADPNRNLLFSVHLYWPKNFGATPAFIRTNLQKAVDAGYALVVGEFSRYGAYAGEASICSAAGEVEYTTILEECQLHQIGWYAWEWGPGNTGGGDPLCTVMDMTTDSTLATLRPGWATEVVQTHPFGILNTSVIPRSMLEPDPVASHTPAPTSTLTPAPAAATPTLASTVAATPTPLATETPSSTSTPTSEPVEPTASATEAPAAGVTPSPTVLGACSGDCNRNGQVTVDELVKGVHIVLGHTAADECAAFDTRKDGRVTIDELVQAVNAALAGCPDGPAS